MRAVFQFPASITAVVDAPRAVSSEASPTRPLWAVTWRAMPAAAAVKRWPICWPVSGTTTRGRRRARGPGRGAVGAQGPHGAGGPVFEVAEIGRVAVRVRLGLPDGDEHPGPVGGVGHVAPLDRAHFRAAHPGHEEQPGDHPIHAAAGGGDGGGLGPPPGATRVRARGEHGGEIVGGEGRGLPPAQVGGRAAVARQHPRGAFPGGRGLAGELGPEVRGLDDLRGGAGGAARLEHVGEVGGQARVLQGAGGGAVGGGGGGGNRGGREAARGGDGARQGGAGGGACTQHVRLVFMLRRVVLRPED